MKTWPAGAAVAFLTLLSFFQFPGHTWLQQDSQIYVPILEHLRDPAVLAKDILVERPHVSFTLYDECALAVRKITGMGFKEVLGLQQILTRGLGIWGLYLLATAAGLELWPALLATAILTLGGMTVGPQVLIFEYEPTPRAFAFPLLILATGFVAHRRYLAGGVAGAAAFLIHPPTVYPFWAVYACLAVRRDKPEVMLRRLYAFAPMLAAAILLFAASRFQPGQSEAQAFFTRVSPLMEQVQRLRTPYVWLSTWWRSLAAQYLLLWGISLAGWYRLRGRMTNELSFFYLGLPLVGMLSMPVSWLLLEHAKWALMPQFQPLRALLFVTLLAMFSGAVAGCTAAQRGAWLEGAAWFAVAFLVPVNTMVTTLPDWRRAVVILLLAGAAAGSFRLARGKRIALVATALAAFFVIPGFGRVVNYPALHTSEVEQLAAWARSSTPVDTVFLFPGFGKDLSPGIFRAEALRAVYADWKGGGQVNYLKELGEQWWARWQQAQRVLTAEEYRRMGVDYVVVRPGQSMEGMRPVFENARFWVYRM
jgi:hypothetical protein